MITTNLESTRCKVPSTPQSLQRQSSYNTTSAKPRYPLKLQAPQTRIPPRSMSLLAIELLKTIEPSIYLCVCLSSTANACLTSRHPLPPPPSPSLLHATRMMYTLPISSIRERRGNVSCSIPHNPYSTSLGLSYVSMYTVAFSHGYRRC